MSGGIAFFDLDRTVLASNSASGWIRRELRLGHMSRVRAARGAGWVLAYQAGLARIEGALHSAIRSLEGLEEQVLRQRTIDFWEEEVHSHVRPGAYEAISRHREAGDQLVLLSSTSQYLAEIVVAELGLDGWLANRFEVADGLFTGRPAVDPLCYGAGKVVHAEGWAAERGVELSDCAFYTDSYSDLPVLLKVGEPVLVAPDPRLSRAGRKHGWRVEDWGP